MKKKPYWMNDCSIYINESLFQFVKVYYIDFGNTEMVKKENVCKLNPDFAVYNSFIMTVCLDNCYKDEVICLVIFYIYV